GMKTVCRLSPLLLCYGATMQKTSWALLGMACALFACSHHSRKGLSSPDVVRPPIIETQVPQKKKAIPRKSVRRQAQMVSDSEYMLPPDAVISLLEREPPPEVHFHAGSRRLVRRYQQALFTREQMQQPFVSLAGIRINVRNFALGGQEAATRLRVSSIDTPSDVKELRPPEGALFGEVIFSPDGQK